MLCYKLLIVITIAKKTSEIEHVTITRKQWVSNEGENFKLVSTS